MNEVQINDFNDLHIKHHFEERRMDFFPLWHYTSVDGLMGIIRNEKTEHGKMHFWFTRSDCLNDTSEGEHILNLFKEVCSALLNEKEINQSFYECIKDATIPNSQFINFPVPADDDITHASFIDCPPCHAYICSFSLREDSLDMWRYYSKGNGGYGLKCYPFLFDKLKDYEFSDYDEVYRDCKAVHDEILRFASPTSLAKTTTVHYCLATESGLQALCDNGVTGLLGLFGNEAEPQSSYGLDDISAARVRSGEIVFQKNMAFAPIDIVLNSYSKEKNLKLLFGLTDRDSIWVMIHEQYFYEDYIAYQPDFEEKLTAVFAFLTGHGYESCFFENLL